MAFKHGIYIQEEDTKIQAMINVAFPPVVIGTAPISAESAVADLSISDSTIAGSDLSERDYAAIGEPVLIHSMNEFKKHFGYAEGANWTLCQAAEIFFTYYNVAPVIFINIFNPEIHKTGDAPDVSKVTALEIKNAIDAVEMIYPRLGVIPGPLLAPKYSTNVEVSTVLAAKARNINGVFRSIAIVDLDTTAYRTYATAKTAKLAGGRDDEYLSVCWPMVGLDDAPPQYLSVHMAALMSRVDTGNDDIPYESPSNKILSISKSCLADGTLIDISQAITNELNAVGIVTALRFNGWRLWGNRTGAFPALSDVKDVFIPIRRMFVWVGNMLVINFFSRIDNPMNKRLIESIMDSCNIWLNGLAARGAILGGRVSFLREENPDTELLDGKLRFHVYLGLVLPAETIQFVLEYDTSYFETLFS